MTTTVQQNVAELKSLLPLLQEKERAGLILPKSYSTSVSLINWFENRGSLTEKQQSLVGRMIYRAKRKHTKGNVTVTTAADTDKVVEKVLEKIGDQQFDAEKVADIVMGRMEARVPRKLEIVVKKADTAIKVKGDLHPQFEKLLRAANSRVNGFAPGIFLSGEASSGKTTGARMLAQALGVKWYFNGAISFPHEMIGFIDGHGKYHRTPFRDAYEFGGVYTFDEVDRSDPTALLAVNPHLANGVATFPDGQIVRHPDCIIICTANTWGHGADANYSGATKLDAAFLSRFPVRIGWDIDPILESKIVAHPEWLARVRNAREKARANGLKVLIDTRIAQAGAALIQAGYSMDEAASMTYLANLKPAQRAQIGD